MRTRRIVVIAVAAVVLLPLILLGGLVLLVQSEAGERWLERQVASRIHREVQVEDIRVKLEWPLGLTFERIRIGNPDWAKTPNLVDGYGLHAQFELRPLLDRRVVLPYMSARQAEMGLEMSGGKATWRFGEDEPRKDPSRIELRRVFLEDGHIVFRNEDEDTELDARVKGSLGAGGVIEAEATGKFRGEKAKASVRLPELQPDMSQPLRFEGKGSIGATNVAADGVAAGERFETLDLDVKVSGPSLKKVSKLTGVVLPETPPFSLKGHLKRAGNEWTFDPFNGKVGDSDLAGSATYRKGSPRPFLAANLKSNLLDFDDLGPLVGAPPKTGPGETASGEQKQKAATIAVSDKVIPRTRFETERWDRMDADVRLAAKKVLRPRQLPIDSLTTHLVLRNGVVTLDPLNFGYAGGRVTSYVKLDGNQKPMQGEIRADIQGLKFARMFPTLKTMDEALGTFYGRADLKGRGNSVAELLDTSDGKLTVAANGGQVSQLLTELLEIDVAKAALLLGTRKQQVELRCMVGHLQVKDGVAVPEQFVVDTTETNVNVKGAIDLGEERLALETRAKGKSPSLVTLRSPIEMEGPFRKPKVHPKAGPIVAQAGAAAALAAVNPGLAIVPFVSRGSGKDADCDTLLAEARKEGAVKKTG